MNKKPEQPPKPAEGNTQNPFALFAATPTAPQSPSSDMRGVVFKDVPFVDCGRNRLSKKK